MAAVGMDVDLTPAAHESPTDIATDLQWLRREALKRCLFETARWAEECLFHMPDDVFPDVVEPNVDDECEPMSIREQRKINFIQGLIQNKNVVRALYMAETKFTQPQTALKTFLLFFSAYLVHLEKSADKAFQDVVADEKLSDNLPKLLRRMHVHRKNYPEVFDCWNNYLQGLISKSVGNRDAAVNLFVEAIKQDARCWPAWEELATMVCERSEITFHSVPTMHWYYKMFVARAYRQIDLLRNAIDVYEYIGKHSLGSVPYVICENAACSAELQEHNAVFKMYQTMRKIDPYRVEGVEVFSDSMFVQELKPELFILARRVYEANRYAWQTHATLANYFSASGQNTNAWQSLQTAIKLSPKNHLLYIILGHLYMELRKPIDAISSYTKAIALNPNDYRGYYGLGQTYEIFKYVDFAVMNYEKAHRCRPNDSRCLVAMGVMYYKLRRHLDAEKAFIQAFKCGDVQGNALCKLANLFEDLNKVEKAAKAYKTFLKVYGGETGHGDPLQIAQANAFLAQYSYDKGQFDEAEEFANACVHVDSCKEKALALQQKIRIANKRVAERREDVTAVSQEDTAVTFDFRADASADRVPTDDEVDDMNLGSDEEISFS
uniref:TPR_REGION domain-containing protein n=1 Tax=Panagrellus redivivus TaxID=6233 RepID=A0A7E4UYS4_PANRE